MFNLILFFGSFSWGAEAIRYPGYSELAVVSCKPGEGPGEYVYSLGAGVDLLPVCFAIDPNSREFYIPEVDTRGNTRLHIFKSTGVFLKMLTLEPGPITDRVSDIVSNGNHFWLLNNAPCDGPRQFISEYERTGKLIRVIGQDGPIPKEEIQKEKSLKFYYENPLLEKFFKKYNRYLYYSSQNRILFGNVVVLPTGSQLLYNRSMDILTGTVVEQLQDSNTLVDVDLQKIGKFARRNAQLSDLMAKRIQVGEADKGSPLIGPDNEFYYMSVMPKKLEIRKVIFDK
jgi:hypothetical protein